MNKSDLILIFEPVLLKNNNNLRKEDTSGKEVIVIVQARDVEDLVH